MRTGLPYDQDMTPIARTLRVNATPEEGKLWQMYLRKYPVQFKRQKPFGRYVVDFYCSRAKLAVELDGSQHFTAEARATDEARTAFLNALGIEVIRFTNEDVNKRIGDVCRAIDAAVKARMAQRAGKGE